MKLFNMKKILKTTANQKIEKQKKLTPRYGRSNLQPQEQTTDQKCSKTRMVWWYKINYTEIDSEPTTFKSSCRVNELAIQSEVHYSLPLANATLTSLELPCEWCFSVKGVFCRFVLFCEVNHGLLSDSSCKMLLESENHVSFHAFTFVLGFFKVFRSFSCIKSLTTIFSKAHFLELRVQQAISWMLLWVWLIRPVIVSTWQFCTENKIGRSHPKPWFSETLHILCNGDCARL